MGINNNVEVCGSYRIGWDVIYGFHWDLPGDVFTDVGSLMTCNPLGAVPVAINDQGTVVGHDEGADCSTESWMWTRAEGMNGLGDLPGGFFYSRPFDINNLDQVVGESSSGIGFEAFLWDPPLGMIPLGYIPFEQDAPGSIAFAINDDTWIVGETTAGGFIWTPDTGMVLLADFTNGTVLSSVTINNRGQMAGLGVIDGRGESVFWDPTEGAIPINRLPAYPNSLPGTELLNDRGVVVGRLAGGGAPAFLWSIWDRQRGVRLLGDLIDPCWPAPGNPNSTLWLTDMNDTGQIVAIPIAGDPLLNGLILTPYIPGDLDEDGDCDLQDLAYQLSNFGRTGDANYEAGDLDCDQNVDLEDLSILLSNFGETLP